MTFRLVQQGRAPAVIAYLVGSGTDADRDGVGDLDEQIAAALPGLPIMAGSAIAIANDSVNVALPATRQRPGSLVQPDRRPDDGHDEAVPRVWQRVRTHARSEQYHLSSLQVLGEGRQERRVRCVLALDGWPSAQRVRVLSRPSARLRASSSVDAYSRRPRRVACPAPLRQPAMLQSSASLPRHERGQRRGPCVQEPDGIRRSKRYSDQARSVSAWVSKVQCQAGRRDGSRDPRRSCSGDSRDQDCRAVRHLARRCLRSDSSGGLASRRMMPARRP